jgi:hypothetical protein
MFKRFSIYILSIAAVLSLVWLQVEMSRDSEDYSERKEIRAYETGMSSRDYVPFCKFDPRSKTAQHIHRTGSGESVLDDLFLPNSSVFSAFICECIGSFPRYHSAQIARKEKIFILNQVFRI